MCVSVYKSILRIDTRTFNQISSLEGHESKINGLTEVGDSMISCSDDGTIKQWDCKNFMALKTIKFSIPITCISTVLSRCWLGTETREIIIMDKDLNLIKKFNSTHKDIISTLTYISSARTVWSASWDSTFIIWA